MVLASAAFRLVAGVGGLRLALQGRYKGLRLYDYDHALHEYPPLPTKPNITEPKLTPRKGGTWMRRSLG